MSPAELARLAPGFDWADYLRGAGLSGRARLVVTQDTALPKIASLVAATPIDTLKAWLAFRVGDSAAPFLSRAFADARFKLRDQVLAGQKEQKVRWKRGILAVGGGDCGAAPESCFGTLNWGVGQLYSARYFPPATKARISALVADVKAAFRARMEKLDWMGPATKAEALAKLDTYTVKVGYPDKWRDYSRVAIRRDDLVGDVRAAAVADWAFNVDRSNGPVDRDDWLMTPQTNDAYNGSLRDIVFPAGILQSPMFDAEADPAINYGGIGHDRA
jgi:putative endopeptidase